MATTAKVLFAADDLANAAALLYTSPATGLGTWIDKVTGVNHSGAARTVTIHHVASGGSVANTNMMVDARSIADKATYLFPELVGKYIPPGASIHGFADTAGAVAFEMSGREITSS